MNVDTTVELSREKDPPGMTKTVNLTLRINVTNVAKGEAVVGAINAAMEGARKTIDTTLGRSQ